MRRMAIAPIIGYFEATKGCGAEGHTRVGYRSMLEAKVMEVLDSSPDVDAWEYETLAIPYGDTVTRPDFIVQMVDNTGRLVEAKGKHLLEECAEKIAVAREWCRRHGALYFLVTDSPPWTVFFPAFAYIDGSAAHRVAFTNHLHDKRRHFGGH